MCNISTLKETIMQCKESYLTICLSSLYIYISVTPFDCGHDADVAHGKDELDTPGLREWRTSAVR